MNSATSFDDVVKHNVLTGFNRFIYLALLAIGINIADSILSGYGEYYDVYVLTAAGFFLLLSLLLILLPWLSPFAIACHCHLPWMSPLPLLPLLPLMSLCHRCYVCCG